MGTCSYANLLQALCIPEGYFSLKLFSLNAHLMYSHFEIPQVSPVRAPYAAPVRSPITDTTPAPPIKPRLMNLPPSLRDSNVITWADDPKKVLLLYPDCSN